MLFLFPIAGMVLIALCLHKASPDTALVAFAGAFRPVGLHSSFALLTLSILYHLRSSLAAQTAARSPRPVQVRGYGVTPGLGVRRD